MTYSELTVAAAQQRPSSADLAASHSPSAAQGGRAERQRRGHHAEGEAGRQAEPQRAHLATAVVVAVDRKIATHAAISARAEAARAVGLRGL